MKTINFNVDEINCIDEYEETPNYVKGKINPQTQAAIRKAYAILLENPQFKSIHIDLSDWSVDKNYGGKPRYGRIALYSYSFGLTSYFEFVNDWSGAEFEADITDKITLICADLMPVKAAA